MSDSVLVVGECVAVSIDLILAISIPGCLRVAAVVVVILVDAFVSKTVDGTEGIADLDATEVIVFEVGRLIGVGGVEVVEDEGIHLFDFVEVLSDVGTELQLELADLGKPTCRGIEVPTLVAHDATVDLSQCAETVSRSDTLVVHNQVGSLVVVDVELEVEQVIEQTEVETEVDLAGLLPADGTQ